MLSSVSLTQEGVVALVQALIFSLVMAVFIWWLSRRKPTPPEPKKPKYSQKLREKFTREVPHQRPHQVPTTRPQLTAKSSSASSKKSYKRSKRKGVRRR